MSKPKVSAPPPPPPAPPTDLREVDEELKRLGYVEGEPESVSLSEVQRKISRGEAPRGAMLGAMLSGRAKNPNQARINELLDYRKKFMEAEDKVRTSSARGRMANVFAGAVAPTNLAARTLTPV